MYRTTTTTMTLALALLLGAGCGPESLPGGAAEREAAAVKPDGYERFPLRLAPGETSAAIRFIPARSSEFKISVDRQGGDAEVGMTLTGPGAPLTTDRTTLAASLRAGESYELTVRNLSAGNQLLEGWVTVPWSLGTVPLERTSLRVLFTNPLCRTYGYDEAVESVSGEPLTAKPQNAFCSSSDWITSSSREASPQHALLEWIDDTRAGDEIFLAYFSFSNRDVSRALCEALGRGARVTFVLEASQSQERLNEIKACGAVTHLRGGAAFSGSNLAYHHNKLVMFNADDGSSPVKIAFSSGNMSSGVALHQENWTFLEVNRQSYFVESHRCVKEALLTEEDSWNKQSYTDALDRCRAEIPYPRERDLYAFFAPKQGDGEASTAMMRQHMAEASRISIGAHRLMYVELVNALTEKLQNDPQARVRLVADDDLYWLKPWDGVNPVYPTLPVSDPEKVGDNTDDEVWNVANLWKAGTGCYDFGGCGETSRLEVKYMQTNHWGHLLHHNKFLIFEKESGEDAVLFGAANLTGAGFGTSQKPNMENMYISTIPEVVAAFKTQYARFWSGEKAPGDDARFGNPACPAVVGQADCVKATGCSWSGGSCLMAPYVVPQATAPQDMPRRNVKPDGV